MTRKKVAIVGSGCAGFGAAWALNNSEYEIHLFEKEARLGGHTNTQTFKHGHLSVPVDTGFIVMNTATYPNFINFLKAVGVDTMPTPMTFAVSRDHGKFEWSGEGQGIFAQRRNIFRPGHWRMLFDITRFNEYALDLLYNDDARDLTIGEYLKKEGYSQAFRDDYLIPMTAAVWSTSPDKASLEFPAQTLIRFLWNHHLLSTLATRPDWLTIPGGSQQYIDVIIEGLGDRLHVHSSCKVTSLVRPPTGKQSNVLLAWSKLDPSEVWDSPQVVSTHYDTFDHIIVACHGDQILPMLTGVSERGDGESLGTKVPNGTTIRHGRAESYSVSKEERSIFNSFQTSENICYLHSDLSLMPTRRKTWSSWNYLINSAPSKLRHPAGVSLTYNMNILQHIPVSKYGDVMVTMNPDHEPKPELTQGTYMYRHPLYTVAAVRAQERLEVVQNQRGVSFCGAWTKYGFHEDGFSSGLKVAIDHLGAKLPFEFKDSTFSRGHKPALNAKDHLVRTLLSAMLIFVRIVDFMLRLPIISTFVDVVAHIGSMVLDLLENAGVLG